MPIENGDRLEVLTTYENPLEANLAQQILAEVDIDSRLSGGETATMLSYVGTAVGGVRLLVRSRDLREAAEVLTDHQSQDETDHPEVREDSCEETADDDRTDADVSESTDEIPELVRAYRTAIIGLAFFPFGVQLYSLYLIARYRLFLPDRGGNDWRFYVAMLANTIGLYFTKLTWSSFL